RRYINAQLRKRPQQLPAAVDLRPNFAAWNLAPKSQGRRNTCSVCVTTSALEYAVSRQRDQGVPLSAEHLSWACNQVIKNETEDRGQFFHDLLKGFDSFGLCEDEQMPYQPRFTNPQPSETATKSAQRIGRIPFQTHFIKRWSKQAGLSPDEF